MKNSNGKIKNLLRHIYAPEYLKKGDWLGDAYSTKEVYTAVLRVAWPAILETVLIGLISFVDTIMVSTCGIAAIAAVGLTNQPKLLFYAVFFALNVGVTAIVSRRKGEDDRESANRCMAQAISVCAVLGVILLAVSWIFARPLIIFAGGLEDTTDLAVDYFRIVMVGTVFTALGLMINAAHRGCGNTKISMYTNVAANLVNILFNYLLINGIGFFPKLGVRGAAIATLLGNIVSCLISFSTVLFKKGYLKLKLSDLFKIDKINLKLIFNIGSSTAVEQLFLRFGFFTYAKIVASLGTTALATHQICMSILNLSFTFGDGLSITSSSLVGQNLGRKRPDMSQIYGRANQRIGLCFAAMLFILFTSCGTPLLSMFTDEKAIIETGIKLLVIIAFSSPAQISQVIFAGSLRGAGDTKYVAVVSFIAIGIIRPLLTYIFCYPLHFGLIGAWITLLIDQYLRLMLTGARFRNGKWMNIKI